MTKETTDQNFDNDVLKSSQPVLVDFWAPWCGPCRQLTPIIDEIAKDTEGKLAVFKCNIDENPEVPSKYGVRSIPTCWVKSRNERNPRSVLPAFSWGLTGDCRG